MNKCCLRPEFLALLEGCVCVCVQQCLLIGRLPEISLSYCAQCHISISARRKIMCRLQQAAQAVTSAFQELAQVEIYSSALPGSEIYGELRDEENSPLFFYGLKWWYKCSNKLKNSEPLYFCL
jgi:hypothetical protein